MGVGSDKTRIIVTLPTDVKERLDKQALKERRTVANLVSSLITDYLIQTENIEKQQYWDYLANYYLSNNFFYNQILQEMQQQGFNFTNMPPIQVSNYAKGYVISNRSNDLLTFAESNGISFEKFINNQGQLINNGFRYNDPYQQPMFPDLYDNLK